MKQVFTVILILFSFSVFAQQAKPGKPLDTKSTPADKLKEPVYMLPTGSVNDTAQVYAVLVTLNQPLTLQSYRLITKSFIYEDGTKKASEQFLEKVVDGIVTPITDWRKKTLYIIEKKEFKE